MAILRITLFKIKDRNNIQPMISQYQTLSQTAQKKDSKPYILSCTAREPLADSAERAKGYNVAAMARFADMSDVKYYDEQCEAHGKLKAFAKDKVDGPPLVVHLEEE
ncbi:hypothetical protein LTR62_008685 [Meristemomyces frigidus]|uniref:Stress-response A/B barrel domain-containing protein n=1 Tax=Meristemomyces frigidus TaxID=1508187 RepID=A0AAN7TAS6_9PEZI|nr:hypothetical protein LTR62_008685 [Meristemomyces frigidus]